MRFDCGETWAEKKVRLSEWHRWFAWHPVKIKDHDWRWLEFVGRKGVLFCGHYESWWSWEYREIKDA